MMKQLHVKLNENDYKRFKLICIKMDKSMSDVIREYVYYVLERYG